MNNLNFIQVFGYTASAIIAISMTQSSIIRFRWINFFGASMFASYGFVFGAYPVGILNSFIMLVDLFYLKKIYFKKNLFDTLEIRRDNKYLLKFLEFHQDEIQKSFPGFEYKPDMNTISFFVLRNTAVAGIFLAHTEGNHILKVGLDYVVPEYRDYKNGKFVYEVVRKDLSDKGITKIIATSVNRRHTKYLIKCGFQKSSTNEYIKYI